MLAPSASDVERLVRSIWTRRLYSFYLLFDDSTQSLSSASYPPSAADARANRTTTDTDNKGGDTRMGSGHLSGIACQSEQALLARRIDSLITRFAGDYRYLWLHLGESLGIRLPPLVWGDGAKRQPEEKKEGNDLLDSEGPPTAKTQKDSRRRPKQGPYVHYAPQFEEISSVEQANPPRTSPGRSTRVGAKRRGGSDADDLVSRALVTREECLAEAARLFGGGGGDEEDADAAAVQQIVSEIALRRKQLTSTATRDENSRMHSSALMSHPKRTSDERVTSRSYGSTYPGSDAHDGRVGPDADLTFFSPHHDTNSKSAALLGSPDVSRIYPAGIHVVGATAAPTASGGSGRGYMYSSTPPPPPPTEYDLHESSFATAFCPLFPEDKGTGSASLNMSPSTRVDLHHQPIVLSPTVLLRSIYRRKLMAYYTLTDSSKTLRDVDECISFFANDAHRDKALRRAARRVRAAYHPAVTASTRSSSFESKSRTTRQSGTSASKQITPSRMTTSGNGRLGKAESFSSLEDGDWDASDASHGSKGPPPPKGRGYNSSTSFHSFVSKGSDEYDSGDDEEDGVKEREERVFSREVIALSCMWKSLQAAQGFYVPPVDTSYAALNREKLRLLSKVFSSPSPSSLAPYSSGLPHTGNQSNSSFTHTLGAASEEAYGGWRSAVRAFSNVSDYGSPLREAFNPNMSLEARERHDAWQRGQVFPHYPEIESRSLALIKKRDKVLTAAASSSSGKQGGAVVGVKAKSPPKTRVVVNTQSAATANNHPPYMYSDLNRGRELPPEGPYHPSRMDALTTEALIAEAFYQKKFAKHFEEPRRKDEEAPKAQISPAVYTERIRRTTTLFLTLIGITFEQYKSLSAAQRSLFREYLIVDLSRIMLERKGGLPTNSPSFALGASTVSAASSSVSLSFGTSRNRDTKSSSGIAFAYKGGLSYSSASGLVVSGQVSGIVPVGADVREIVEDTASGGLRVEVTLSALSEELDKRKAPKKDNEDDPDGFSMKKVGGGPLRYPPEAGERGRSKSDEGKGKSAAAATEKGTKKAAEGQLRERYERKISERYVPQLMELLLACCGQKEQQQQKQRNIDEGTRSDDTASKRRKDEKGKGVAKDRRILLSLPLTEKLCREGGLISFLEADKSSSPSRRSSPSHSPLSSRVASYASLLSPASSSSSSPAVVYSTKFGVREAMSITKASVYKEVVQ